MGSAAAEARNLQDGEQFAEVTLVKNIAIPDVKLSIHFYIL